MIGGLAPADMSMDDFLARVARATVQAVVRLAIVVRSINDDKIEVMDLDTFEEISDLLVPDNTSGEARHSLGDYLHVVALDGPGAVAREPQCFRGGFQCNWHSIDGAPPPSSKSSFMCTSTPHTLENVPMQLLGRLADPADFVNLAMALRVGEERLDAFLERLIAEAAEAAAGQHPPQIESSRGESNPDGEQRMRYYNDCERNENLQTTQEIMDDPAWLGFLEDNPGFLDIRRRYIECMEWYGWDETDRGDWQDDRSDLRVGDIILFRNKGCAEIYHPEARGRQNYLEGSREYRMQAKMSFAVVDDLSSGAIHVRELTTLEEFPGSLKRGRWSFHEASGKMRYELEEYLHVVALDSEGSVGVEPECFRDGFQCKWRSIDSALSPSNKSWFMSIGLPRVLKYQYFCVVGELAGETDIAQLRMIRAACFINHPESAREETKLDRLMQARDNIDADIEAELQRLKREVDPRVVTKPLNREYHDLNGSQGQVHEDRDFCEGSGQIRDPWVHEQIMRAFDHADGPSEADNRYRIFAYARLLDEDEVTWSYDD